ncbi:MAG: homoserine dehydrogenase [Deltaproteobacteria bacterium CG07_land_8_20_14_0_80_60_11]|nr:MAG: homoserine dehydrogenase [Deltaproteobacteria bacterium CG07_land_8_20_14_0_80_60_11]
MKSIKIGLIGFGTVGSGVVRLLTGQRELLARRLGADLVLKKVADLDLDRPRPVVLPADLLTTRAEDILDDPEIDIVVELIGGAGAARDYVMGAIARGKHVVTANKALLALHGNDLLAAAAAQRVEVAFEASVCGGIPIILALRQGLAANRVQELFGILNGTANYILTRMTQSGASYAQALAEAQAQGFAEADPTLDVEGIDTAHKLAILMSLAYGSQLDLESIAVEGISRLDPLDLQFAGEFGYCLKLLAITRDDGRRVEARVHPTLVPRTHMLANVGGAMNAVYLTGEAVGPILLYGQGAGMMPTASAVVSDLIDLARNIIHGVPGRVPALGWESALSTRRLIKPINDLVTNYYFRFSALDQPGVLSQVSGILGKHNISIAAVIQKGREVAGTVPIVMITHEAREADARQAMAEIDQLPIVSPPTVFYRIEDPHLHAAQI